MWWVEIGRNSFEKIPSLSHSQTGTSRRIRGVRHFTQNNNSVMNFSHFAYLGLARVPGKTNAENIFSRQLLTLHLTGETCLNPWHSAGSARVQQRTANFFFRRLDISLTRRYRGSTTRSQACSQTHTHRGRWQSRTQPWKSSLPPGIFPEWPVWKSKTIARSLHLFAPPLHPSI